MNVDDLGRFGDVQSSSFNIDALRTSQQQRGCFAGVCVGESANAGGLDDPATFGTNRQNGVDLSAYTRALGGVNPSVLNKAQTGYNPLTGQLAIEWGGVM